MALDDLQQYGVATYDPGTVIEPYNRNQQIESQAADYLAKYAPQFPQIPTGGGTGLATPEQPQQKGPTRWEQQLQQALESKGDAFTPEDFERLKEGFKINLTPRLYAAKLSQAGVEAELAKFDYKADTVYRPMIFGQGTDAQTQASQEGGSGWGGIAKENIAALAGGILQTVPGVMALADYGLRTLPGIDGRTPLGSIANEISEGISGAVDRFTTPETLAQREAIAASLEADPSLANVIEEYLGNGRNLGTLVSGGLGSLVVPFGAAKYLGRAGGALENASKLGRAATVAGISGLPASGTQGLDLERRIDATPLEDLVADNPRLRAVIDAGLMLGADADAIEKQVRDEAKAEALRVAMPAYIAGNVGLAMLPGSAESQISRLAAGQVAPGLLRRVATGVGVEGAQEGGAAALQSLGENYGLNRPLGEGAVENIVPNTIVGGLVGGAVSLPGGRKNKNGKKTNSGLKARAGRATETAQGATSEGATPTAEGTPTPAVGPYEGAPVAGVSASALVGLQGRVDRALEERTSQIKRFAKDINSPNEAILRAQNIARMLAGDDWTKLNTEQRLGLVEKAIGAIAATKSIPNLGEAVIEYKARVLAPVNPTPTVVETGEITPEEVATQTGTPAAPVETPTIPPAPAQTPTAQNTTEELQGRQRLQAIERLKTLLKSEFNLPEEELVGLTAEDLGTLYAERKAKDIADRKAATAEAEARARKPNDKLKKVKTAPTNQEALLNNYLAYLADKPLMVDPQYLEAIQRDPRLADAKKAMSEGKITDVNSLRAFLQGEAAASTEGVTPDDSRLVGAILGDKKLKKASDAKVEVREHLKALEGLITETEARKMTLAQLRQARKQLSEVTTKPKRTIRKTAKPKEKPKPKETPPKAEPAKKGKTSPKTQAPAKQVVETGAQQIPAKEKAARKSKRTPKLTAAEQVRQRFSKLDNGPIEDLIAAVELAQQGEQSILSETITEFTEAELVTKDDAKFLRKLANQEYKAPREALKEEVDAIIKEAEENSAEENPDELAMLDVAHDMSLRLDIEEDTDTTLPERAVLSQEALESLEAALMSSDDVLNILEERQAPARGAQEIATRLAQLRANPNLREAADFAIWLLSGNPQVANVLSLTTAKLNKAGAYNPLNLLIKINESGAPARTIVHEILHHTERMLPTDLQKRIRGEYAGRLVNKLKQARAKGDTQAIAYLETVIESLRNPSETNRKRAVDFILSNQVDADEFYKYLNPSEYWAEVGSEILSRRHKDADDWKARLKEWFREFLDQLKNVLGLDNTSAVYKGLREVLEGTGDSQSTTLLREGGEAEELFDVREGDEDADLPENAPAEDDPYLMTDGEAEATSEEVQKAAKATRVDTDAGWFQNFWERVSNNALAFEEIETSIRKAGGEVTFDNSPSDNYRIYNGRVSRNNMLDRAQVVNEPVDWVDQNWATYAHDKQSFIEALNVFFGNTNFLERIRTDWLLKVPLKNGMEVERIDILDGLRDRSITPEAARRRLVTVVQQNAAMDMREHAIKNGISEATFDAIQTKLDELYQAGIDQESMAELNTLLDSTRARIRQRLVEAGYFTADDPYQEFYGWKWYVPLKGVSSNATDIVSQNAFDLIPQDKLSLAKLNKQIEAMQGRKTFGQRPFERLFVDLARAGERSAHTEFMQTIYDFVVDNQKKIKARINVWKGNPRDGYTNPNVLDKDGNPKVHSSLPKPRRGAGFVFNDGDTHYVVDLPRNSQLLRGLIMTNATLRPPEFVKKWIATPTYLMARGYTTLSPFWQTATGFVRDLTTLPITAAAEAFDSPIQATGFFVGYGKEILQLYRAAPTLFATLRGDVNALEEKADNDPDSYAAWLRRWQEGGGSNEYTKAFTLEGVNRVFNENIRDADGIIDATKAGGRLILKWTGNYANFLEQMSRVAAFKTFVEVEGMSDKEAAVRVRKVLDYQQTGTWGRSINSWIAFFRVGMTSVDTMRRIFRKPTGGLDGAKLGKWTLPFAGMGAMAYFMIGAMLGDDDEGKKRMHKIRASTLTQKVLMPFGDDIIGVNIGLGLPQLLLAPGVLAAAVMDGHITPEEAASEMYETVLRNGPFRLAGYKDATPTNVLAATLLGITPTTLAPIFSLERNTDVFGRPIHSEYDNPNLPHSEQGRSTTPKFFTDVARAVHDWTGGLVDYYPEDIRYMITNYGGQNVSDLIKMTGDIAAKNAVGIDAYYNPATTRFEVRDEDYYDQERMYKLLDEAGESKRRVETIRHRAINDGMSESAANNLANRFLQTHPEEAEIIKAAKRLAGIRRKRSEVLRKLSRDRVTSIGRKQIIRKEEDRKMREATDRLEALLEQLE